jgi:hypothetical protein
MKYLKYFPKFLEKVLKMKEEFLRLSNKENTRNQFDRVYLEITENQIDQSINQILYTFLFIPIKFKFPIIPTTISINIISKSPNEFQRFQKQHRNPQKIPLEDELPHLILNQAPLDRVNLSQIKQPTHFPTNPPLRSH